MKKNLIITTMLLVLIFTLTPIHSYATSEIPPINNFTIPSLQSADSNIVWSIPYNTAKTRSISCTKNETLSLTGMLSSSSASAKFGVIDPDGTYHTTTFKGEGVFSYDIPSTGTYKIFCQNLSSSSISISITYQLD